MDLVEDNKMTATALSVVWGPNVMTVPYSGTGVQSMTDACAVLVLQNKILEIIIKNAEQLF
jgi:hypothetical protein